MAKLTIRNSTTGELFDADNLDFTQVTPQQIIDNMRNNLPAAGQGMSWRLSRSGQTIDQQVTLDQLGFRDGDTADLVAKVAGA